MADGIARTRIGVLGTGSVGRALAGKLAQLGSDVMVGTRSPAETMGRKEPDEMGNEPFGAWREAHPKVKLGTFAEAAAHGEIVVNATNGIGSLAALKAAGEKNLAGKVLVDVANPLDFSKGMPPTLSTSNTDSLGEQIQRAFPSAMVVKTLNTVTASVMIDPKLVAGGDHTLFLSGNDAAAKEIVTKLLQSLGWRDVLDLGDITTARGAEMILPLWLRVWGALDTPAFNFKVVR